LIGVFQQGVPFQEALKTYTILTVGDGLVSILPSLLVSVAAGIVVTRATSKETLSVNLNKQLFNSPRLLWIAGGALAALGLIPGLPKFSFFSLAAILMFAAWKIKPQVIHDEVEELEMAAKAALPSGAAAPVLDPMDAALKLDELMLDVGVGLVPLVDAQRGGQLLSRVKSMRKSLAQQLGFLVPSIHITDNLSLREREYVIYLRGVEIARWELRRDSLLAITSNPNAQALPGQDTREPAFDVPAKWISPQIQGQAIAAGYAVVDSTSVLAAHLAEVIKHNAHELLSRHETRRLIDRLSESHPKLADELIPKLMSLGEVQKVLQQLLREQVSIRDLGTILETLVEAAAFNKNPIALVEAVRHTLGRSLIRPLLNEQGELKVVTLDTAIEDECTRGSNLPMNHSVSSPQQVTLARRVLDGLRADFGKEISSAPPVLLCSSPGRYYLRRLLEPFIPRIVVISPGEVPPLTPVQSVGVLH
jgi:flagellar biosynthesis protein FlhA